MVRRFREHPTLRCTATVLFLAGALIACQNQPITNTRTTPRVDSGAIDSADAPEPGELWSAGLNDRGQLGRVGVEEEFDTTFAPVAGPGGQPLNEVVAVAAGTEHSLAALADGAVLAWGGNGEGQLGDGTRRASGTPVPVLAPDGKPGKLTEATAVAANTNFSMALLRDGTVVTWGANDAGQRGIGRRTTPPGPTTVRAPGGAGPLREVTGISADGATELALLADGSVVSWGRNTYGMLGDGSTETRTTPVPVRGPGGAGRMSGVSQVSAGGQHGLALLRDGRVLAWGRNHFGQLGDGTLEERHVPDFVAGVGGQGQLTDVVAVAASERHNYALRRDGTVVAWGDNTVGQLGDGTLTLAMTPVQVAGSHGTTLRGVAAIFAGEASGSAVLTDGSMLTWGANGRGQLGSGTRLSRSRPGPIVLTHGERPGQAVAVAAGERHQLLVMRM